MSWTRWSPTSRRYSRLLRVRPGRERIAALAVREVVALGQHAAVELLDLLLEPVDVAQLRLARVVQHLGLEPSMRASRWSMTG